MGKLKSISIAALAVAFLAVLAGPAAARDRNHDRIPDRWEKRHHLSLHVNQARRDQDRDGLRNRAEFKAHLNPRDDDTDNDGIDDADEHAGTIQSFDKDTGRLTIHLFGGDTVSGFVDDSTEIECDDDSAHTSSGGDDHGDDQGEDQQGDDPGDDTQGDDDQGDDNDDQGDDQDENDQCGTEALTVGREVDEADLELQNGKATFEEIELA